MRLASYIRPFDAKQKIYVLDNKDNTEEIRLSSLEGFAETVMQLTKEYQIDYLELHGQTDFCLKLKDEIQQQEMINYSKNELPITIKIGDTI